jgi:hypothetical protein
MICDILVTKPGYHQFHSLCCCLITKASCQLFLQLLFVCQALLDILLFSSPSSYLLLHVGQVYCPFIFYDNYEENFA